jgi:hypothetical protein
MKYLLLTRWLGALRAAAPRRAENIPPPPTSTGSCSARLAYPVTPAPAHLHLDREVTYGLICTAVVIWKSFQHV